MVASRSLIPAAPRALTRRQPRLALDAARLLPVATRAAALAVVGVAAEYVLRSLTNRVLSSLVAPASGSGTTRTVMTEITIVERPRRG